MTIGRGLSINSYLVKKAQDQILLLKTDINALKKERERYLELCRDLQEQIKHLNEKLSSQYALVNKAKNMKS